MSVLMAFEAIRTLVFYNRSFEVSTLQKFPQTSHQCVSMGFFVSDPSIWYRFMPVLQLGSCR